MVVRMPRLDGLEATPRILAERSQARVIVLTTFDIDEYAYAAMKAGASGFLLKDLRRDQLICKSPFLSVRFRFRFRARQRASR